MGVNQISRNPFQLLNFAAKRAKPRRKSAAAQIFQTFTYR
ncbi:Hypothetical protein ABZS17G119_03784 [Kosakonia cowanii]